MTIDRQRSCCKLKRGSSANQPINSISFSLNDFQHRKYYWSRRLKRAIKLIGISSLPCFSSFPPSVLLSVEHHFSSLRHRVAGKRRGAITATFKKKIEILNLYCPFIPPQHLLSNLRYHSSLSYWFWWSSSIASWGQSVLRGPTEGFVYGTGEPG